MEAFYAKAVRKSRLPPDFMFQVNKEEFGYLRSQIVISKGRGGRRCHGALENTGLTVFSLATKYENMVWVFQKNFERTK
jgi:hypothetical protein